MQLIPLVLDSFCSLPAPVGGTQTKHVLTCMTDEEDSPPSDAESDHGGPAAAATADAERLMAAAGELPPQWLDVTTAVRCGVPACTSVQAFCCVVEQGCCVITAVVSLQDAMHAGRTTLQPL